MCLLLAVLVTAASVQDSVAGTELLDRVAAEHPRVRKAWVDGGYRQHLVEHAAASAPTWKSLNAGPGQGIHSDEFRAALDVGKAAAEGAGEVVRVGERGVGHRASP